MEAPPTTTWRRVSAPGSRRSGMALGLALIVLRPAMMTGQTHAPGQGADEGPRLTLQDGADRDDVEDGVEREPGGQQHQAAVELADGGDDGDRGDDDLQHEHRERAELDAGPVDHVHEHGAPQQQARGAAHHQPLEHEPQRATDLPGAARDERDAEHGRYRRAAGHQVARHRVPRVPVAHLPRHQQLAGAEHDRGSTEQDPEPLQPAGPDAERGHGRTTEHGGAAHQRQGRRQGVGLAVHGAAQDEGGGGERRGRERDEVTSSRGEERPVADHAWCIGRPRPRLTARIG